jgi:hypothetical protein
MITNGDTPWLKLVGCNKTTAKSGWFVTGCDARVGASASERSNPTRIARRRAEEERADTFFRSRVTTN